MEWTTTTSNTTTTTKRMGKMILETTGLESLGALLQVVIPVLSVTCTAYFENMYLFSITYRQLTYMEGTSSSLVRTDHHRHHTIVPHMGLHLQKNMICFKLMVIVIVILEKTHGVMTDGKPVAVKLHVVTTTLFTCNGLIPKRFW